MHEFQMDNLDAGFGCTTLGYVSINPTMELITYVYVCIYNKGGVFISILRESTYMCTNYQLITWMQIVHLSSTQSAYIWCIPLNKQIKFHQQSLHEQNPSLRNGVKDFYLLRLSPYWRSWILAHPASYEYFHSGWKLSPTRNSCTTSSICQLLHFLL